MDNVNEQCLIWRLWKWRARCFMTKMTTQYDVVILGSGPAGLQAALHAARAKAAVAVLGRMKKSSLYRAHIENYCCLEGTTTGDEMLQQGRAQAEKFGAAFHEEDVTAVEQEPDGRFRITLESGDRLEALAIIFASGIHRNRLNVPGEKDFLGKGVSYCVDCDANFYRNQPVVVVGNESAAVSGALALLLYTPEVHLVYRDLAVDERLSYQLEKSPIRVHPGTWVQNIHGDAMVQEIVLESGERIAAAGIFIELGAKGAMELAGRLGVMMDAESMKYIAVNKKQETNVPGVYAAGDICGPPWQVAKAVGEGCVAGLEAASHTRQTSSERRAPASK
jgi:thioredoxin reductase (NADPH)